MAKDNRGLRLATTLIDLAEIAESGCGEAAYAEQFTMSLAAFVAPTEVCLALADDTGAVTIAASTSQARELVSAAVSVGREQFANLAAGQRPMLNRPVTALRESWPELAATAAAAGYGMMSALAVRRRDLVLGVICTLGPGARRLSPAESDLLGVLAKAAAVAIVQQRELAHRTTTVRQLQQALDSRVVIEQAKGIVAARLDTTTDTAFRLLRAYARRRSCLLAGVAAQAVHGDLPVYELLTTPHQAVSRPASLRFQ